MEVDCDPPSVLIFFGTSDSLYEGQMYRRCRIFGRIEQNLHTITIMKDIFHFRLHLENLYIYRWTVNGRESIQMNNFVLKPYLIDTLV